MNRLAAMQLWPLLMVRAVTAVFAASSMSALGITMNGSEPPSSITAGLSSPPAVADTARPAPSEPVRLTAVTRGSFSTASTSRLPISRVVNTPAGKPASRSTSSMARAQPGTLLACLSSPVFPAIRVGAMNRNACQYGKFHGMTASTTPRGWYVTNASSAPVWTGSDARNAPACSA